MLYQLIAYYTIHAGTKQTLWEYISWTVIVFQNAAALEVIICIENCEGMLRNRESTLELGKAIIILKFLSHLRRSFMLPSESSKATCPSQPSRSCPE